MWSPCSSMRWSGRGPFCSRRPLAPLPPSRQPSWWTVTSWRARSSGVAVSSKAVARPPAPPPRIATRRRAASMRGGTVVEGRVRDQPPGQLCRALPGLGEHGTSFHGNERPGVMSANIVVPADGTPAAEAAAWYAGAVAEGRSGAVHVVAAWEPPGARAQDLARTLGRRSEVDAVLADMEGALGAAGLTVHGHVRRCGLVAALVAVAAEQDAELIVVPAGWTS